MTAGWPFLGSLFAEDFLREFIAGFPDWDELDDGFQNNPETDLQLLGCVVAGGLVPLCLEVQID